MKTIEISLVPLWILALVNEFCHMWKPKRCHVKWKNTRSFILNGTLHKIFTDFFFQTQKRNEMSTCNLCLNYNAKYCLMTNIDVFLRTFSPFFTCINRLRGMTDTLCVCMANNLPVNKKKHRFIQNDGQILSQIIAIAIITSMRKDLVGKKIAIIR